MVTVKDAAIVSNGANISINSLFNITPTTKYLYLNVYGSDHAVSTVAPSSGTFICNGKLVKNTSFSTFSSATILFELKNNQYVSSIYGNLSDVVFSPAKNRYLNMISVATADTINPGLFFNMDEPGEIVTELSKNQYSASILTMPGATEQSTTVSNIINTANSFVGKTWSINGGWTFVNTVSTLCGTSLPMSSISTYNHFEGNDKWTVKYNGLAPNGDWKKLLIPGDVILLSTDYMRHSGAAICVSGTGTKAMVVDTVITANNVINNKALYIAPAHLLNTEDVYSYAPNDRVFILRLNTPPISQVAAVSSQSYATQGLYDVTVNPKPDIKLGSTETFNVSLNGVFVCANPNIKLITSITGAPSWVKYNAVTNTLTGTSPKVASSTDISFNFKIGTYTGSDSMKIIVNPKQLVDIKSTAWSAGTGNSLSINKECTDTYRYTVKTSDNMDWLDIDQINGKLFGTPPVDYIGHKYNITVYQQNDVDLSVSRVDDFTLSIIGIKTGFT